MLNCRVQDYGARGDGQTPDTAAVQAAIDDCSAHGGGRVTLSEGRFLCTRIDLKSGVDLHIERDAVLLGSADGLAFEPIRSTFWRTQYAPRFNDRCFIYAEQCEDIAITGRGAIDCQGEKYVDPLPEGKLTTMSYVRKPYPISDPDTPEAGPDVMYGSYAHPVDPRKTSLAPARVVLFMGCKHVLVEDVTMRNQPAGWGYWVCGCEDVHFHRADIRSAVDFPNNDGIHINCCRNVTVSDCNITCGDDGIVVRAYSLPLQQNTPCEKIAVSNCNITSHACGVRLGWINDGLIRDCAFTNLNITESNVGIGIRLPGNPGDMRISDQGEEATHIEQITFSNILMDRVYHYPVEICISEHNLCDAIRKIYFSGVHATAAWMPVVKGREDCHVQDVYFDNCHFAQMRYEEMHNRFGDRFAALSTPLKEPIFAHVDNLTLNGTVFSVL